MQQRNRVAIAVLLLAGLAAAPASGERIEYYVWTDGDGVIHAGDTPPADYDYETRVIEVDENVIPAPAPAAGEQSPSPPAGRAQRSPSRAGASPGRASGNVDAGIADEEQHRLDEGAAPGSGGGETAPGAETAAPGGAATGGSGAAGGVTAPGAATAPGAPLVPPPLGP